MSNENSAEKRRGLAWPLVIAHQWQLAMVAGLSLALLLIPQLSVRAAVQGRHDRLLRGSWCPAQLAKAVPAFPTAKRP